VVLGDERCFLSTYMAQLPRPVPRSRIFLGSLTSEDHHSPSSSDVADMFPSSESRTLQFTLHQHINLSTYMAQLPRPVPRSRIFLGSLTGARKRGLSLSESTPFSGRLLKTPKISSILAQVWVVGPCMWKENTFHVAGRGRLRGRSLGCWLIC
jgi:hypothetical protein